MSQIYADYHGRLGGFEVHDAALRRIPEGAAVLDVGCATGFFSRRMKAEKGCRVIGIESDPDAAASAREVCDRVHAGDLADESFLRGIDEQADVVYLGDVVEHLADPAPLLRRLRGWLTPGGFLLCSVPNVAYWKVRVELLLGRFDYQEVGILDRTHLRFYTRQSFEKLLAQNGFHTSGVDAVCSDADALRLRSRRGAHRPSPSRLREIFLLRFPRLMATQFLFRAEPEPADRGKKTRASGADSR